MFDTPATANASNTLVACLTPVPIPCLSLVAAPLPNALAWSNNFSVNTFACASLYLISHCV